MDVSAKEVVRLVALDEIADRGASEMFVFAGAIEVRAYGRCVTNEDQRIERGEGLEAAGELVLGILARRVERGRVRVAESGDVKSADLQTPAVKIVESVFLTELRDVGFRFMISRQHVCTLGPPLHDRPKQIQPAAPVSKVAVGEVVIHVQGHHLLERVLAAVDVGKDEKLHLRGPRLVIFLRSASPGPSCSTSINTIGSRSASCSRIPFSACDFDSVRSGRKLCSWSLGTAMIPKSMSAPFIRFLK